VKNKLYEIFHHNTNLQTKIISKNNFTYRIILSVVDKYLKKGNKILDIGSGAGTLCLYYGSNGYEVLGIDISQKAIIAANASAEYLGLKNVKFSQMNFPHETPKDKFDFIIFTEVIEHLEDDDLALKKIFSLLNSKGIAIISTPSKNAVLYKLKLATEFDKRVGHLRRYTIQELVSKCKKNRFTIRESRKTEGVIRNFLYLNPFAGNAIRFIKYFLVDLVLFIDSISMKLFGESNIFVVVQKP
jgi:SAM-dependent methyltransferase